MLPTILITRHGFALEQLEQPAPTGSLLADFLNDRYTALYRLAWIELGQRAGAELLFLKDVSSFFHDTIGATADIEWLRERVDFSPEENALNSFLQRVPFMPGHEAINRDWIYNIASKLLVIFRREISQFTGKVAHYYENRLQNLSVPDRIFFHLVESKDGMAPFAFMATYSELLNGKISHKPLKAALDDYSNETGKLISLLTSISKIEKESALISTLLDSGELFYPIRFSDEEAYTFLKEIPIYESCGVKCRIPNWWKTNRRNVSLTLKIGEQKSKLSAKQLMTLKPHLALGEVEMTRDEVESFLSLSEGLHLIKNRWVEVNHERLKALLDRFDKAYKMHGKREMNILDMVKIGFSSDNGELESAIDLNTFARQLTERIKTLSCSLKTPLPKTFRGILRPYQETGRLWLHAMGKLSLGVCLADDMGLGKTVQLLAYLDRQIKQKQKHLLVLPTSLLGNWEKEIKTFAPDISYTIYHGKERTIGEGLTITTYGTVRKDEMLKDTDWDGVILDEAQAIKNPVSKQTRAIKALKSNMRIALTGTPIENNLVDLYSLFDFLNPGLLGNMREFKSFVAALESEGGYERLRTMIAPFLLRRLKTDKEIIKDLPDKLEIKEYIDLTAKQVVLYEKVMRDFAFKLETKTGVERRGLILAVLGYLKQILNHPSHYSGDNLYKPVDSNKFVRLGELCETIAGQRERVLVFTQYRELTEPLAQFLEKIFNRKGLVLHGGTHVKERSRLVETFNNLDTYVPFMVLSLKAGGVGLNLTAANHVIHFDRWWNPAVENQATDRAFRIGQKKDVFVRKFVSRGSVEEKIDELIESKTELAGAIVHENKAPSITELSNDEIMKVFQLT